MRPYKTIIFIAIILGSITNCFGEDPASIIKKAVSKCTLNQNGTKPFHLRATLAPSRERDNDSKRTGEIEIWWKSPTQWRREVSSPGFHQIAIRNERKEWQKNEGDYFPEWLRQTAVALIEPVPFLEKVLKQVETGDSKQLGPNTYFSWQEESTNGTTKSTIGGSISINHDTGLFYYGGGLGWGGLNSDYMNFQGRMVARKVSVGSPEVTAIVTLLEELDEKNTELFDTAATSDDAKPIQKVEIIQALQEAKPIQTLIVDEIEIRKNLIAPEQPHWPTLDNRPYEGSASAHVVIDRQGKVRECSTIVSSNRGVNDVAKKTIESMTFRPYLVNGVPVQVISRITLGFNTISSSGQDNFDTAQHYFDRGRIAGFPSAGIGAAYILKAKFKARTSAGQPEEGEYVDTWKSPTEWKREATIGKSHYTRSQHGEKRYQLEDGPDVPILKLVFQFMEPLPSIEPYEEPDWHIKREIIDGVNAVRLFAGSVLQDGTPEPGRSRVFWFNDSGVLLRANFAALESQRSDFVTYQNTQVARRIILTKDGKTAMIIEVKEINPAGDFPDRTFEIPGHEWRRAFTAEVR